MDDHEGLRNRGEVKKLACHSRASWILIFLLLSTMPATAHPEAYYRIYCMAWSPDGKMMATGSWHKTIRLWDADTGKLLKKLAGRGEPVAEIPFGPDTNTKVDDVIVDLAFGGTLLASAGQDGAINLWDPIKGKLVRTVGASYIPVGVALAPDGKTLAYTDSSTYALDANLRIMSLEDNREIKPEGPSAYELGSGWDKPFISRDGRVLLCGGGNGDVLTWELATGKNTLHVKTAFRPALAVSPDGKVVAAGNQKGITFYPNPSADPAPISKIALHDVSYLEFSPDGHFLAAAISGKTVLISYPEGKVTRTFPSAASVRFSPDGKRLALRTDRKVEILDIASGKGKCVLSVK